MDVQNNSYLAELELKKSYFNSIYTRGRNHNWGEEVFLKPPLSLINSPESSFNKKQFGLQVSDYDPGKKVQKPKNANYVFRKLYQFIYVFMDSSSIHGFGHLTAQRRHPAEYIIWGIFLVGALIGTAYIGRQAWIRYQYYPTVISMERDYKNWNTSFPTAAVCPDEKLDENKLRNLAKTKYKVKDVEKFVAFFKKLALLDFENFGQVMDYNEISPDEYMRVLTDGSFNYSYEVSNSYDSESGELTPIITEMGLCYTYNSEVAVHFTPTSFFKNSMDLRVKGKVIYGSPLDGELFSQIMTMNSGYNMTITGPYDIPDVTTKRMNSEPLFYKTVELTALSIISSDSIRDLKVSARKCRYYDESKLEISDIYTYILCRMQCRMDLAYKLCKCIPFFYRKIKGKPYCGPEGLRCIAKNGQYVSDLRDSKTNKKAKCDCLPLCNDVHFVVEMDNTMSWRIATNLKWGMIRYPRIRLKREIIFGFSDLLVSVGGTAALFLGCSVLSFVEVIYFFTLRLIIFIIRLRKREKH